MTHIKRDPSAQDQPLTCLEFSDAFCLAKFEAAALSLAVRGFTIEYSDDIRARGLEKLAEDHLDRMEELLREFDRMRESASK